MKQDIFYVSIFIAIFFSCKQSENKALKTETITIYEAIENNGKYSKGNINTKYSLGFHPNGSQRFFAGLVGYEGTKDTTFYEESKQNEVKKEGNKSFIYSPSNELIGVYVEKSDTSFFYLGESFDRPDSYEIRDNKGRLKSRYEYILGELRTYTNAIFNDQNLCTYAILEVDYIPTGVDSLIYNEIELAKRRVEKRKKLIYEAEYTFY
ncbi:hypothetical protein [Algoriphagus mannitolivorans]|uniref:hypothetical protein n=1 Tax=Algoriphagus mannitolivorans TaxID=226504 RepID=UPI0012FADBC0|nr:hypothetical protein [Algoriphagus mannitolivorans]